MHYYFILNEQGDPVAEPDQNKWVQWCFGDDGMEHRRIAADHIEVGQLRARVSTVFLGSLHPSTDESNDETLFETMVFGDDSLVAEISDMAEQETRSIIAQSFGFPPDIQVRYSTRDAAVKGHQQMVQFVQVCLTRLSTEKAHGIDAPGKA